MTTTGQSGAFDVQGLADGVYRVCVEPVDLELLNPCLWNPGSATFQISGGRDTAAGVVVLERASRIVINIDDPERRLPQRDLTVRLSPLSEEIIVWLEHPVLGRIPSAPIATANGRRFEFVVAARPIPVHIESHGVLLADGANKALPRMSRILTSRPGQPATLNLTVRPRTAGGVAQ